MQFNYLYNLEETTDVQLSWLEDFVELARTRSFTRAAENRFVTHPAFGRRIRALEQWVGTELIERTQPISLTAAGILFLDAASHSLDVLHSTRSQVQESTFHLDETLRIATGHTLAKTFFPDWYSSVQKRFGTFPVSVSTSGAQQAIMRLSSGDADLLLSYASPTTRLLIDPKRFEEISLGREMLVPVCAQNSKGRPQFHLSNTTNTPIPWLAFASSLTLRGVLAQHLAGLKDKLFLKMVYQSDSYESILEMAKRGTGLAWLPQRLIQQDLKAGSLMVIGESELSVSFDISLYRLRGTSNTRVNSIWDGLSSDFGLEPK